LPESRIHVKPNCYPATPSLVPWSDREDKAVFLGRVSAEKGLDTLIQAWTKWGADAPKLEIIGQGPDLDRLRGSVPPSSAGRIAFLGARSLDEAHALLSTAKLLIVPSVWFEGFPLVLCEAFAFGVPVAASRLGTFEELVEARAAGRLFSTGDPDALRRTVSAMWDNQPALERMSRAAHREFETRYSAPNSVQALQAIYDRAIHSNPWRGSSHTITSFANC
jgi:glycosyltransferase involved in cell wall biosynthesis